MIVAAACLPLAGCQSDQTAASKPAVTNWHQVGSWSGRGTKQTETFTSDTGGFRVRWATTNETVPGEGALKVILRSADSGREIVEAVDARGVDSDAAIVAAERPRWYYLSIDSANVDWTVSVDERIDGQRVNK